jgi:hypothetical protein
MHAPLLSQAVAPQVTSVVLHGARQQSPAPLMPHTPEVQASFSVQAPVAMGVMHAPPLQTKPVAQSGLEAQVVLQLVALAQARWLGQATGGTAGQVPAPSQVLVVSALSVHESVQPVVLGG